MNIIIDDSLIFFADDKKKATLGPVQADPIPTRSASWFLETGKHIFEAFSMLTDSRFDQALENIGGLQNMDSYFVQVTAAHDPVPYDVADFQEQIPYSNPHKLEKQLLETAQRGWLHPATAQGYRVTRAGCQASQRIFQAANEIYAKIESLPEADLEQLEFLLGRVVQAAEANPAPPMIPTLELSAKFSDSDHNLLRQVRRRLVELFSYRDDSHIAAWKPYEKAGYVWEAFTYIWTEGIYSPQALAARLEKRGYSAREYAEALEELGRRGWITEKWGKYTLTAEGKALRESVETQTNLYFDAPWEVLTQDEIEEVQALLHALEQSLVQKKTFA